MAQRSQGETSTLSFLTGQPGVRNDLMFTRNPQAKRPTLNEALALIQRSEAHRGTYVLDEYDCKHFAQRLYNEVERAGWRAGFVVLSLMSNPIGHAIVSIQTSDAGRVFVDLTPLQRIDRAAERSEQFARKDLIRLREGHPYLRIPLEQLPGDFRNREADFVAYEVRRQALRERVQKFLADHARLARERKSADQRLKEFNRNETAGVTVGRLETLERQRETLLEKITSLNRDIDELNETVSQIGWAIEEFGSIGENWVAGEYKIYFE